MAVSLHLGITDPFGFPLLYIGNDFILDYILTTVPGAVGVLELSLPLSVDQSKLIVDGRIGVYRSIDGRPPYLDNGAIYLISLVKVGVTSVFIRAYHVNVLMARRYVLYDSGTTFSNKTAAPADDLIKTFWKENAGASIGGGRDGVQTGADLSTYVQVQPNLSQGPSIAMSGSRDPLDNVLKRIADASATAGTYLTYEIISLSPGTMFEFRTYVTVRGVDHSSDSFLPVTLSEDRGNLVNATYTTDYTSEVTFACAGGQGQAADRATRTSIDANRTKLSPFHRIEKFVDATNTADLTVLQSIADAAVRSNRPVILAGGTLVDTAGCTRGIHYDLGDIINFEGPDGGQSLDVRLEMIHEHYDASASSQGQPLTAHQKTVRRTLAGLRGV